MEAPTTAQTTLRRGLDHESLRERLLHIAHQGEKVTDAEDPTDDYGVWKAVIPLAQGELEVTHTLIPGTNMVRARIRGEEEAYVFSAGNVNHVRADPLCEQGAWVQQLPDTMTRYQW